MPTLLSTVKTRLALTATDYDGILTNAILERSAPSLWLIVRRCSMLN